MEKQIQMPEKFLLNVLKLCWSLEQEYYDPQLKESIEKQIEDKFERMENRNLYTKSKFAKTEEEREKARIQYLDKKGIPENFRYKKAQKENSI